MKKLLTILSLMLVAGLTAIGQTKSGIQFTEYQLDNGLHVIFHQDNSTPNVVVSLMYHVGAKNEDPSRTGFAHFFEHLMFEGSKNIPRGEYMKIVEAAGGSLNANTTQDRTYYYELMPSNQLELALWMESERMLHANVDTTGVNTQKGVVIEERKQSYENRPYGTFMEELGKRAFTVHPYQWQTIGYPEHIRNSNFEDIYTFYKTYYVPNNAVLIVAGDFDEKQAKEWIEKYFADIPRGTLPINRPTLVEPAQKGEIRDVVYDNIQLPAVFMGYHTPASGTKDAYALEILTSILSGGSSSRFKVNIDDKKLAMESVMFFFDTEHPGLAYVLGIANAGGTADEVEAAINAEIEKVRVELVSENEFKKAIAQKEFEVVSNLGSIENVAYELANGFTYFKDANRINRTLSFYSELTREDLLQVAKKYLSKDNRVVLHYLPKAEQK